jgi:hypothetical protein
MKYDWNKHIMGTNHLEDKVFNVLSTKKLTHVNAVKYLWKTIISFFGIHILDTLDTKKTEKKNCKYFCEKCQYKYRDKNDYKHHLLTLKHNNDTLDTKKTEKQGFQNFFRKLIFGHF